MVTEVVASYYSLSSFSYYYSTIAEIVDVVAVADVEETNEKPLKRAKSCRLSLFLSI